MQATLLQIDFPYSGPWGREAVQAMSDLARDIAGEPGLRWKLWTESPQESRAGGIYAFEDATAAERYLRKHTARLAGFGITGLRVVQFQVNEGLTALTRGPLG